MNSLHELIRGMPKAELHLHIEGSLEPELAFALAARNGAPMRYDSVAALREAYKFTQLQDFLELYYQGMSVLDTEQDFFDLTFAYLQRAHADNVRHAEIFFDPQGHTGRGIALATVVEGIGRALDAGAREFGLSSCLIMCFLRHLEEDDAFATLVEAEPWLGGRIVGVGLDSTERGNPPAKFQRVFAAAREHGLHVVAHAGEEGPPAYVREALEVLKVERIDHGNRALEDPAFTADLAQRRIPLTVCPLSNLKLRVVDNLTVHPLRRMLDAGLVATVSSDDPAYFGGYVNDNFIAVQEALKLDAADLLVLARNSFQASFLPVTDVRRYVDELDAIAASCHY